MATGETLFFLEPKNNDYNGSDAAIPDRRNGIPVLDFSAASTKTAIFPIVIPTGYDGGGLTCSVVVMASTATSGGMRHNISIERWQDDVTDLDSDSFDTAQAVTATAPSASGETTVEDVVLTNAQIDGILAGEPGRLKYQRDHDHAGDDMAGDMELLRIIVKET